MTYPQTPPTPNQPPTSQFPNQPGNVPPATPPTPSAPVGAGPGYVDDGSGGSFNNWNPSAVNQYGGQQIAGATPSQADYQSVQGYADAAHENARRYLDPQQESQNKRMAQQLINQGIDPMSPAGKERMMQMSMQQADANNAAAFGALQFGQGIQNQMAQQELANQQLAGNMQQALWNQQGQASGRDLQWGLGQMSNATARAGQENQYNLGMRGMDIQQRGQDQQFELGKSGQDLQRYGMDQQYGLGMGQLDLGRNQAEHGQMMDLLGYDMQTRQYNDQQQMMQDAMFNQWYGNTPIPGMNPTNPYSPYNTQAGFGDRTWWNTSAQGNFGIGF